MKSKLSGYYTIGQNMTLPKLQDRIEIYSQKQYLFQRNKSWTIIKDRAKQNPH